MRTGLCVFGAAIIAACGARSQLDALSDDSDAPSGVDAGVDTTIDVKKYEAAVFDAWCELPPYDAGAACEGAPPPANECAPLHLTIDIKESCALTRPPACEPLDLAGYAPFTCPFGDSGVPCANTGPGPQQVFAMNRFGAGHVVAWCDMTSLFDSAEYGKGLVTLAPIFRYLGRTANPRVACVGDCWGLPVTSLGSSLPNKYVGSAGALAADWDVIVVSGAASTYVTYATYGYIEPAWAPTFRSFASDYGKGLLVVADYTPTCRTPADVYDAINAITEPAGIRFMVVDLGYATMTIDAGCVADLP